MEINNPKKTRLDELTLNIDMLTQKMKNLPEDERESLVPRLQTLSKEYHLHTGHYYRPENGWGEDLTAKRHYVKIPSKNKKR